MTNKTDQIDPQAFEYAEKTLSGSAWGSPVGLAFFIIAVGIAVIVAFVAFLHVAEVIP